MKFTCHLANRWTPLRARPLLCLVAALLLQAPVLAGLLMASGACCLGNHCAVAAHHHAARKSEEPPMDCDQHGKHGADQVRSCSISCCTASDEAVVHSNVFLLSPEIAPASAGPLRETVSAFEAGETAAPFAPLSPPPRSLAILI